MKEYREYKDSNDSWIGDIPTDWKALSYRHLVANVSNGTTANQVDHETEFPVSRIETISTGKINFDKVGYLAQALPENALKTGDIILSHINSLVYVGNCAIFDLDKPLYHGMNLLRIQPNTNVVNPKFHYYLVISHQFKKRIQSCSKHAINQVSLSISSLKSIRVSLPPLPEQKAIADFLDRKTAQIDTLIEKKQRQIDLLQEQRTALINHAVTKGLNPDAPMKDSGVEWLGEIPSHWEVKMLKWIAYLQRGHDLPSDDRVDGEFPIVSSSGVSGYHNDYKAKGPGVITGRYGTIGEVYFVEHDYWPLNTTLYVKDFYGNYARFIYYLLKILPFKAYSEKSAVPGVDRKDLHKLLLGYPPVGEQKLIAEYLDKANEKISQTENKIKHEIVLLQEYRTALISEAVTGKIDVRGETVHE